MKNSALIREEGQREKDDTDDHTKHPNHFLPEGECVGFRLHVAAILADAFFCPASEGGGLLCDSYWQRDGQPLKQKEIFFFALLQSIVLLLCGLFSVVLGVVAADADVFQTNRNQFFLLCVFSCQQEIIGVL